MRYLAETKQHRNLKQYITRLFDESLIVIFFFIHVQVATQPTQADIHARAICLEWGTANRGVKSVGPWVGCMPNMPSWAYGVCIFRLLFVNLSYMQWTLNSTIREPSPLHGFCVLLGREIYPFVFIFSVICSSYICHDFFSIDVWLRSTYSDWLLSFVSLTLNWRKSWIRGYG